MIRVVGLRGQNLCPEDGTTVEPYVILGTTKTQTEVIKKNFGDSCEWKDLNGFEVAWDGISKVPGLMELHVNDYVMTGDDYMGYASITLDFGTDGVVMKLVKKDKKALEGKELGSLWVRLEYTPAAPVIRIVSLRAEDKSSFL